jgi:hypothetical protein
MKASATFQLRSSWTAPWMSLLASFLILFWVVILITSLAGIQSAGLAKLWIVTGCYLFLVVNTHLYYNIFDGASLMHEMRTPRHLWRSYLSVALKQALLTWILLALAITTLAYAAKLSWQLMTIASIVSILVCSSTIAALSHYGLLPRVLSLILIWGAYGLLAIYISKANYQNFLETIDATPPVLRILIAFSAPLLTWIILRNWWHAPPLRRNQNVPLRKKLSKKLSDYSNRFVQLHGAYRPFVRKHNAAYLKGWSSVLVSQLSVYIFIYAVMSDIWSIEPGLLRSFSLLGLALFYLSVVLFKDLHWRKLLAPGSLHRGRVGWHIYSVTAVVHMMCVVILAMITAIVTMVFFNITWEQIAAMALRYCSLPFEITVMIGFAVCFSAVATSFYRLVSLIFALVVAGLALLATYGGPQQWPVLSLDVTAYITSLLFLAIVLIWVANKLWTAKRVVIAFRDD